MLKGLAEYKEVCKVLGFRPARLPGYLEVAIGKVSIDIVEFDAQLAAHSGGRYDHNECLYDGKEASVSDVVRLKYGERTLELFEYLL